MIAPAKPLELSYRVTRLLNIFAVLAAVAIVGGIIFAPQRTWANLLLMNFLLIGLGLAGIVFVAFTYVTGAGWSTAVRRVPEAMTAVLPFGAVGLLITLLARPSLFPWMAEQHELTGFRQVWLNYPFFLARAVVYLGGWMLFARAIIRNSRRQDEDGDPAHTRRNARLSAAFLVFFAITFWLASYDWIMSLEPDWYSTIFGVYNFAGMFSGGVAVVILLTIWLERLGPLTGVLNEEHLHDLGKLLFAFTTFWMYIWFSQYMLIWYAHIPEETVYFVRRLHGDWQPLFILNMCLNWGVPFLALLNRSAKRSRSMLTKIALVVLTGRWLDLYLMTMSPFMGSVPKIAAWEIGALLGGAALFIWVFANASRKAAPVPMRDPFLMESLHYHH